jgi:hypothetical protein
MANILLLCRWLVFIKMSATKIRNPKKVAMRNIKLKKPDCMVGFWTSNIHYFK